MKAMKNWMNKPWTWGTYFKLCGWVAGAYCVLIAGICAWEKWKEHEEEKEKEHERELHYARMSSF